MDKTISLSLSLFLSLFLSLSLSLPLKEITVGCACKKKRSDNIRRFNQGPSLVGWKELSSLGAHSWREAHRKPSRMGGPQSNILSGAQNSDLHLLGSIPIQLYEWSVNKKQNIGPNARTFSYFHRKFLVLFFVRSV